MNTLLPSLAAIIVLSMESSLGLAQADSTPAKGPLGVHPANPRYFTDGEHWDARCRAWPVR